jgi:hypothetical protein
LPGAVSLKLNVRDPGFVKVLFDQGTPAPLRHALVGHQVVTADEAGWSNLANGELLASAEAERCDVLVTTDKNLRYQQNLAGRKIAIFVLPYASWPRLRRHVAAVAQAVGAVSAGEYTEWSAPDHLG